MKHKTNTLRKSSRAFFSGVVRWFEYGDLLPLLIVVSAVHYASVLASRDALPVAIAIGFLADLGHYRTVRAAMRYTGADRRQGITRWLIALAMTAISLAYHQRYYLDWWLSVPLPLLIMALAYLQRVDRAAGKTQESASISLKCATCGAEYASENALHAHQRKHANERRKQAALIVQPVAERGNHKERVAQ